MFVFHDWKELLNVMLVHVSLVNPKTSTLIWQQHKGTFTHVQIQQPVEV